MHIDKEKINDPNLTEAEEKIIFRSFLRRLEKENNQERWGKLLAEKYDLPRPTAETGRFAVVRKIAVPIIGIAAAVLLLVFALPGLLVPGADELLAGYRAEATAITYRGQADTPAERLRAELTAAFSDEDFPAAQQAGRALLDLPDSTPNDRYNLGLAYLKTENYPEAEATLRRLLDEYDVLRTEARFYLAVSLLEQGKTGEGLDELRTFTPTDGTKFYDKARELLKVNW